VGDRDIGARSGSLEQDQAQSAHYTEWLSAFFASPDCARLFLLLAESSRALDELTTATGLPRDAVCANLATLEGLGLIREDASTDGSFYRLDEEQIGRAMEFLATRPSDFRTLAGRPAPLFSLPSADGTEVSLEDCLARGPVALWFSSGLACPICRRNRARLSVNYSVFRSLGAELVEVTPTPPDRARMYYSRFSLTFPYLCDPDTRVWEMYGLRPGRLGPLHVLGVMLPDAVGPRTVLHDWVDGPKIQPTQPEIAHLGNEYGFFLIDQSGAIRSADAGPYMGLPANAEIERQLRALIT
jgi:peroxiredoxin